MEIGTLETSALPEQPKGREVKHAMKFGGILVILCPDSRGYVEFAILRQENDKYLPIIRPLTCEYLPDLTNCLYLTMKWIGDYCDPVIEDGRIIYWKFRPEGAPPPTPPPPTFRQKLKALFAR